MTGIDAAVAAVRLGVDQLELCVDLAQGGLSPDGATVAAAGRLGLPLRVMARPRAGDFHYSASEVKRMCATVAAARDSGVAGVVCGALDADGGLDAAAVDSLCAAAGDMRLTFHRALDVARDPPALAARLAAWPNFDRLLYAGGTALAWARVRDMRQLATQLVIGCGGIRTHNLRRFAAATGVRDVHFNAMAGAALDGRLVAAMCKLARSW